MKQGTESMTFTYDAKHRLASETDAAGNVTVVRLRRRRPRGREAAARRPPYRYAYDDDGNLETMTTPRGKVHRFDSPPTVAPKDYTPPSLDAEYARAYSTERALDRRRAAERRGAGHGLRRGRAADVRAPRPDQALVRLRRRAGPLRARSRASSPTAPTSRPSTSPTTGCCPSRWSSAAWPAGATSTRSATASCRRPRSSRWAHDDHARAGVRQGPAGDQDRAVHDRASGPGGAVSKITDGKLALAYTYDATAARSVAR